VGADAQAPGAPSHGAPPVLTLTPNPSLDFLFEADQLVWDDANRVTEPRRRPGGQGINVARAARVLGVHCRAIALLGGATGREIRRHLDSEGTDLLAVPRSGDTRIFMAVRVAGGRSLLLNPRGEACDAATERLLLRAVESALRLASPRWLACCGSVPPGFTPGFYREVAALGRAAGARVAVDCDGDLLRAAAPACDLLVPNQHEAARLLGCAINGVDEAGRAAATLLDLGAGCAAITLGEGGAVIASGCTVWHARVPPRTTGSAVGAGDAFLAALVIRLDAGDAAHAALRHAVAAGAAVLRSSGDVLLDRKDYDAALSETELQQLHV
jgi:1-phosphofructokinase